MGQRGAGFLTDWDARRNPCARNGPGQQSRRRGQAARLRDGSWASWKQTIKHMFPNPSRIRVPKQPHYDKNICLSHPRGPGCAQDRALGGRRTWHRTRALRRPSLHLSAAPCAASQCSASWPTRPWSSLDSALSVCRNSLLLMLTETTRAL